MNEEERRIFREAEQELDNFPAARLALAIVRNRANDSWRCATKYKHYAIGGMLISCIAVVASIGAAAAAYYEYDRNRAAATELREANNRNLCSLINRTRSDVVKYLESFTHGDGPSPGIQRGVDIFSVSCVIADGGVVIPVNRSTLTQTTTTP